MNKEELKEQLLQHKIRVTGLISNGLVHRTPKQVVLRQARKDVEITARRLGLSDLIKNNLYLEAYNEYMLLSKTTFSDLRKADKKFGRKEDYKENLDARSSTVAKVVQSKIISSQANIKARNSAANRYEFEVKHEAIWGEKGILKTVQKNSSATYSPFFLCSTHVNPAKDHAGWEGKMYYDEDYKKFVDDSTADKIEAYINTHQLRSVQWAVGSPVFLVTRTNCKHYLINIPLEEAFGLTTKTLLKKHKMYMKDEENISYEQSVLNATKTRLKEEMELYKIAPNQVLADRIKKDRKLVVKWTAAAKAPSSDTARLVHKMNSKRKKR